MTAWKRYAIALLFLVWLFVNIPAWLFLASYGIYWSLIVPAFVVVAFVAIEMLREFGEWVIGPTATRESRAERIDRLERELGIGQ